jgi:hypothetical protein
VSIALVGVLFLLVIVGLVVIGVRAWSKRAQADDQNGVDIIPYLLLALAVGTAGFTLAALARASLTADQLAGRPTGEIAGSLAGLVVSAPIAFLLWRRQARRRKTQAEAAGWPIYLALIELTFLTAFFIAVGDLAQVLFEEETGADWTDLVVYGGIVAFHWWAGRSEPGRGDAGELPRLVGSGVSLVALGVGLIGTLAWVLSQAYDSFGDPADLVDPAMPLALLVVAGPIWAYRWLSAWAEEPGPLRNFYLGLATTVTLTMSIGAVVAIIASSLTFLFGDPGPAREHFSQFPLALAVLIGAGALWLHHVRRLGPGRSRARRGYEYAMSAIGLGSLVGSSVALVDAAFTPTLAGTDSAGTLLTLGTVVIASGWVWLHFWRKAQSALAAAEVEEASALPRRFYLVGMAIVLGLTAAGALIAVLVIVFRAFLGEVETTAGSLRVPITLTVVSGLATWHLVDQLRDDGTRRVDALVKPFTVTVVCSHAGNLWEMFPKEAKLRVLYRNDAAGVVDEEMASAIASAVDGASSLVWVDQDGFRVAPARQP